MSDLVQRAETSALLQRVADDVTDLKVTAARQEENLKEHMRRTALAEEAIKLARIAAEAGLSDVRKELKPIQRHVVMLEGALKLIGVLAIIVGLVAGIAQLIKG